MKKINKKRALKKKHKNVQKTTIEHDKKPLLNIIIHTRFAPEIMFSNRNSIIWGKPF